MSDDIYKHKKKINFDDLDQTPNNENLSQESKMSEQDLNQNPLERVRETQRIVSEETGRDMPETMQELDSPFVINGKIPDALKNAIARKTNVIKNENSEERLNLTPEGAVKQKPRDDRRSDKLSAYGIGTTSTELSDVLSKISQFSEYDEIELPSKSKFYTTIPPTINIRPMTGQEENILATPRYVKKNVAVDKIFENVIKENIDTYELLSIDRTYLLIFLRGISYTPEYDVEVKCPSCSIKFNANINLDDLDVETCPDDFGLHSLEGVLPKTGLRYKYRLATGQDEQEVTRHREIRVKEFGDNAEDDTLLYRSSLLLEYIDKLTNKNDILALLKKLPVQDVNYIRNIINEPPFGVNTDIGLICPGCQEEFEIALPLESNFFFPRKKKE